MLQAAFSPDTAMMPSITTIIAGFALVCGLAILRAVHRLYDWNLRHEGLPAAVHNLTQKLGELAAKLDGVIQRFDSHCKEEERWQQDAKDATVKSANITHATLAESELRLTKQIDGLSEKFDAMTERRRTPR